MLKLVEKNLPGFNCGNCGYESCERFAEALVAQKTQLSMCAVLSRPGNLANKKAIEKLLNRSGKSLLRKPGPIIGVIDKYKADITISPLEGEKSCREVLLPFSLLKVEINDIIKYRPMGCPITHIARVIDVQGLLITVHIVGPEKSRMDNPVEMRDAGLCMVVSFRGRYKGKLLKVGQTVRFLPHHCMMQKIHSGVVVNLEKDQVLIEGIDLKVWGQPEEATEKEQLDL